VQTNGDELLVKILETSTDGVRDGFGDLPLHEARRERLQSLVKEIVLGLYIMFANRHFNPWIERRDSHRERRT
jgi:hypothetical protein